MSKTILIIGGTVGGLTVASGGAIAGVVVSQQNSVPNNDQAILTKIKSLVENNNKLNRNLSATTIYPDGVKTVFDSEKLEQLGLESTFENYNVSVNIDAISEAEITFNLELKNETQTFSINVSLSGFATTSQNKILFDNLLSAISEKSFASVQENIYIENIINELNFASDKQAQILILTSLNNVLAEQKNSLNSFITSLKWSDDTNELESNLAVETTLENEGQSETVNFLITGFINGSKIIKENSNNLNGDYQSISEIGTTEFIDKVDENDLTSLVNNLSEKLNELNLSIVSSKVRAYTNADTNLTYEITVRLNGTQLEAISVINVTGLISQDEIIKQKDSETLNQIINKINGKSFSSTDTTLSVDEFINKVSINNINELLGSAFSSEITGASVNKVLATVSEDSDTEANLEITLSIGSARETTNIKVINLFSNNLVNANNALNTAIKNLNKQTFNAIINQDVTQFINELSASNIINKLNNNFSNALNGAIIKSLNASVDSTNNSQVAVVLNISYEGLSRSESVKIYVDNLTATQSESDKLNQLINALQSTSYNVKTSQSTNAFASTVNINNVASFVDGLTAKLNDLVINSLSINKYSDDDSTLKLDLNLSLKDGQISAIAKITITGFITNNQIKNLSDQDKLNDVIANIKNKVFYVALSSTTVDEFINKANINNFKNLLVGSFANLIGNNIELTSLKLSVDNENDTQVIVNANLRSNSVNESVSFYVGNLISNSTINANQELNKIVNLINNQTFNSKNKINANQFLSEVNKANLINLLNDDFKNKLDEATINSLTANLIGNNRNQVLIKLNIGYPNSNKNYDVQITVNNLETAPIDNQAQINFDQIINKINNQTFAVKTSILNSTFANNVSANNLVTYLNNSFYDAIKGAAITSISSIGDYDQNSATTITLHLNLSYPLANPASATIKVSNLISANMKKDAEQKQAIVDTVTKLASYLSNTTRSVNATDKGLNTNDFTELIKQNLRGHLPTEVTKQLEKYDVKLISSNYEFATGTSVSINFSISTYENGPLIEVDNFVLNGLWPYGSLDGNEYLKSRLNEAANFNLAAVKLISFVPVSNVYLGSTLLTSQNFMKLYLDKIENNFDVRLSTLAYFTGWNSEQLKLLTNLPLTTPSLISSKIINREIVINNGQLAIRYYASAIGPVNENGGEQIYETTFDVSLDSFIHLADDSVIVNQANNLLSDVNKTFNIQSNLSSEKIANDFRSNSTIDSQINSIANFLNIPNLKKLPSLVKSINAITYNTDDIQILTITISVTNVDDSKSSATIIIQNNKVLLSTIDTNILLVANPEFAEIFSLNIAKATNALIAMLRDLNTAQSEKTIKAIYDFGFLKNIKYDVPKANPDTTDTIELVLINDNDEELNLTIKTRALTKNMLMRNYLETVKTIANADYIFEKQLIGLRYRITEGVDQTTPNSLRHWVKDKYPLASFFHYRKTDNYDVNDLLVNHNGIKEIALLKIVGQPNWFYWAWAKTSFVIKNDAGEELFLFNKDYAVRIANVGEFEV